MFRLLLNSGIPSDIIPRGAIAYHETTNTIVIDLNKINIPFKSKPKVWIPRVPATGSMRPTFGAGNNNLLIAPTTEEDHKILCDWLADETKKGKDNVVVYRYPCLYAVHRAIKVGKDKLGRFFRFRGDKNWRADPYKVRDEHIEHISIGSIN